MEQSDENLNRAIAQMERQLTTCNLPMGVLLTLAKILRDECDARRALARTEETRDQRLTGEINERSQRQLEIAGRLAALERRMDSVDGGPGVRPSDAAVLDRERPRWQQGDPPGMAEPFSDAREDHDAGRGFRRLLDRHERALAAALGVKPGERTMTGLIQDAQAYREQVAASGSRIRVIEERNATQATTIAELERDLANARADAQAHQSARRALEVWAEQVRTALGAHPHESRPWMAKEIARRTADVATYRQRWETQAATIGNQSGKIRDLEAQVAALQKAIDDVWALVERPDGYGSPFWTEPGLDDVTPAYAVGAVLAHLRANLGSKTLHYVSSYVRNLRALQIDQLAPANAEAMAALNTADRQADDDQICRC